MPTNTERRAKSVLSLIGAKAELDRAIEAVPDYTGHRDDEDYYRDEQVAYDAAVAEYEAAHAPTADEIKAHLLERLGADVKVYFAGGEVSVGVGLEWVENGEITERFGHDQDDDYDNQHTG